MPRKLLVLLLPELKTVRVVYQRCNGATEIRVADMQAWDEFPKCGKAGCAGTAEHESRTVNVLFKFATKADAPDLHIQFVIPDDDEPKGERTADESPTDSCP